MNPPSIRRSLLIRCGLGVGVVLILLSLATYYLVRRSMYRELDSSLREAAALLANQVELENFGVLHEWQGGIERKGELLEGTWFQFWDETTGATTRSPNMHGSDLPKFHGGNDGKTLLRDIDLPDGHQGRAVGLHFYPFVLPDEVERMKQAGRVIEPHSLPQVVVVARDADQIGHTLERLRWILGAGTISTLLLGFLLIERAVRASLQPLETVTRDLRDRSENRLADALDLPAGIPAELVGLANAFDGLLQKVGTVRQRERDFIRHAAHELRTPIAGMVATTDLALSRSRSSEEYASLMKQCQTSAKGLAELVRRLSALARISGTESSISRESIDFEPLAIECWKPFETQLAERDLGYRHTLPTQPAWVPTDTALLRIIINNLFDNAVSYCTDGGTITWTLETTADAVIFRVANPTTSALPSPLERMFEPLFRADESRHDHARHFGIGLALSRDAAHALGGTLTAEQTSDEVVFVFSHPRS